MPEIIRCLLWHLFSLKASFGMILWFTNKQVVIAVDINSLWMSLCLSDILIRIVRCHSEGCDTKIHGIKAAGFRYVPHYHWICTEMWMWKNEQSGKLWQSNGWNIHFHIFKFSPTFLIFPPSLLFPFYCPFWPRFVFCHWDYSYLSSN